MAFAIAKYRNTENGFERIGVLSKNIRLSPLRVERLCDGLNRGIGVTIQGDGSYLVPIGHICYMIED